MQRDFGVFVVNLFDTYVAMKLLAGNFQKFSLQYLLSSLCGVELDKAHQRSDWRIR